MMEQCPRGCDAFLEYAGIEDGFGEHAEMCCEMWVCPVCDETVVGDCMICAEVDDE